MSAKLKKCSKCGGLSVSDVLVCQHCNSTFFDSYDKFLNIILVVLVTFVSAGLALAMEELPFLDMWVFGSGIVTLFFLPLFKIHQKMLNPKRQVLKEFFYNVNFSYQLNIMLVLGVVNLGSLMISGGLRSDIRQEYGFDPGFMIFFRFVDEVSIVFLISVFIVNKGRLFSFDGFYSYIVNNEYEPYKFSTVLARQGKSGFEIYIDGMSLEIDKENFEFLGRNPWELYAKDKNNIYYKTEKILPMADVESFELLYSLDERDVSYARDNKYLYSLSNGSHEVIPDENPAEAIAFNYGYLKGSRCIYRYGKFILEPKDIKSFSLIDEYVGHDKYSLYLLACEQPHALNDFDPDKTMLKDGFLLSEGKGYEYYDGELEEVDLSDVTNLINFWRVGLISEEDYQKAVEKIE